MSEVTCLGGFGEGGRHHAGRGGGERPQEEKKSERVKNSKALTRGADCELGNQQQTNMSVYIQTGWVEL